MSRVSDGLRGTVKSKVEALPPADATQGKNVEALPPADATQGKNVNTLIGVDVTPLNIQSHHTNTYDRRFATNTNNEENKSDDTLTNIVINPPQPISTTITQPVSNYNSDVYSQAAKLADKYGGKPSDYIKADGTINAARLADLYGGKPSDYINTKNQLNEDMLSAQEKEKPKNLWEAITPWNEGKGETFGQIVDDTVREVATLGKANTTVYNKEELASQFNELKKEQKTATEQQIAAEEIRYMDEAETLYQQAASEAAATGQILTMTKEEYLAREQANFNRWGDAVREDAEGNLRLADNTQIGSSKEYAEYIKKQEGSTGSMIAKALPLIGTGAIIAEAVKKDGVSGSEWKNILLSAAGDALFVIPGIGIIGGSAARVGATATKGLTFGARAGNIALSSGRLVADAGKGLLSVGKGLVTSPIKAVINPAAAIRSAATGTKDLIKGYGTAFKAGTKIENIVNTAKVFTGGKVYAPNLVKNAATSSLTKGATNQKLPNAGKQTQSFVKNLSKDISKQMNASKLPASGKDTASFVKGLSKDIGKNLKGVNTNVKTPSAGSLPKTGSQTTKFAEDLSKDISKQMNVANKTSSSTLKDVNKFLQRKSFGGKTLSKSTPKAEAGSEANIRLNQSARSTSSDIESFLKNPNKEMTPEWEMNAKFKRWSKTPKNRKTTYKLKNATKPVIKKPPVATRKNISISTSTKDLRGIGLSSETEGTITDITKFVNKGRTGKGGTGGAQGSGRVNDAQAVSETKLQTPKTDTKGNTNSLDIEQPEVNITMGKAVINTPDDSGRLALAEPEILTPKTTVTEISPATPAIPSAAPLIAPAIIPVVTPAPIVTPEPEIAPIEEPAISPSEVPMVSPSKTPAIETTTTTMDDELAKTEPTSDTLFKPAVSQDEATALLKGIDVNIPDTTLGRYGGIEPKPPFMLPWQMDSVGSSGNAVYTSANLLGNLGAWQTEGLFVGIVDPRTKKVIVGGIRGKRKIKYGNVPKYRISGGGNVASPGGRIANIVNTMR